MTERGPQRVSGETVPLRTLAENWRRKADSLAGKSPEQHGFAWGLYEAAGALEDWIRHNPAAEDGTGDPDFYA